MESVLPVLWSPISSLGVLGDYSKTHHGYQDAQVLISQEVFVHSPLYTASQMPSPWSVAYNHKHTANMLQRIFIPSSLENNHKIEVCLCHSPCVEIKVVGGGFLY